MSWVSIVYLVILVLAAVVTVVFGVSIRVSARPRWVRIGLFLLVALVAGVVTAKLPMTTDGKVLGLFVTGMCIVFAAWPRGLASWAVIAGLGSIRVWAAISKVEIYPTKHAQQFEVWTYVGSIRVSRISFHRDAVELQNFLRLHLPAERVQLVKKQKGAK